MSAALFPRLDHLVYATPDLDATRAWLGRTLGVPVTGGGQHPAWGTRNALIGLGAGRYLELIGADPSLPRPARPRPFSIDQLAVPRLVTWAAGVSDLEWVVARAGTVGCELGEISQGSRRRPDGQMLAWRLTDPFRSRLDGLIPFFIDWGRTAHPSAALPGSCRLTRFAAEHPDAERVRQVRDALDLSLPVTPGPQPRLRATIVSEEGMVELE